MGDTTKPGQQTPCPRKKTSFVKKSSEGDVKQDSILRKEQRTRFADENLPPSKNVSFGLPDQKSTQKFQQSQITQSRSQGPTVGQTIQQHQPQQVQKIKPGETKTKSEQNLEKLGITQIHPKPRQDYENRQYQQPQQQQQQHHVQQGQISSHPEMESLGKSSHSLIYDDLQEKKIQEVTTHLTSQLLKKHDQQYSSENIRRRSSVKSANLNENFVTCQQQQQLKHRRTSVPNWSTVKTNASEKKNNTKNNVERKKIFVDEKSQRSQERRSSYKKRGDYVEFTGSDPDVNWSDYESVADSKSKNNNAGCINGSYQNYGYQKSQERLGSSSGVIKYIEKEEYWVTQPDISFRRGSGSQKGRISPYLLKDHVNNQSSPSVPASVVDSAQAQGDNFNFFSLFLVSTIILRVDFCFFLDVPCIHRSDSERGYRGPCHGSTTQGSPGVHSQASSRGLSQASPTSSIKGSSRTCCEHSNKSQKHSFNTNLTHVLSTPDVAAIPPYYDSKTFDIYATEKRSKSQKNKGGMGGSGGHLCTAVSEGELLDLSILPIFQKLLTERHKSRTEYGASIASCPNISIKCDIVEYL